MILLDSGHYSTQGWGALNKCWKGFKIAKSGKRKQSANMIASNMTSSTSPTLLEVVKSLVEDAIQALQSNDPNKALARLNLANPFDMS
ncbi:MAG: hypothetical protein WAM14_13855 [Candidatus Nitrosopolaris sp.]